FSYMEAGPADAPPLLLLHGIGANSGHWRFQYAALQDRYRVIGWNAPGYMLTDNLKAETPSCEDYGGAVAAFLDALGIGKAYVLGNSFGSGV
ncbi:alpha/beta fold hydrolase, partial [Acinetobacter baumannii]